MGPLTPNMGGGYTPAQFTPDELEEQRLRANQLRGMGGTGALMATSQIPGAAQQGQLMQRLGAGQVQDFDRMNQRQLETREQAQQNALTRAMNARRQEETERHNRAMEERPSAYQSNTIKGQTTYQDVDGNHRKIAYLGDKVVDAITLEPLDEETISRIQSGELREMPPISESGQYGQLKSFAQDTTDIRKLASRYDDMLGVFEEAGISINDENPFGWLQKGEGFTQDVARILGERGTEYSAVKGVLNQLVRQNAGMSQTQAEISRLNDQYGDKWLTDPDTMMDALRRLGPEIQGDIQAQASRLSKPALDQYRANLDRFGAPDWTSWTFDEDTGTTSTQPYNEGRTRGPQGSGATSIADMTEEEFLALPEEERLKILES